MADNYSFNVDTFKQNFRQGGARPNLFRVQVDLTNNGETIAAPGANSEAKFTFTCRAASIPAMTLGTIEVPYFGRKIKVAGDRTFAEWTVTVINDEDWQVRRSFELWNNLLNLHAENLRVDPYFIDATSAPGSSYKREASIQQYSKDGGAIAVYAFTGLYPSEIGAVELAWDTNDTIEEFTVTLQYDYFTTISTNMVEIV